METGKQHYEQDRDRKADGRGHDTPLLQGEEAWGNGKRETEGGKL